ncbi:MAG: undecaprenyl/decaprenyl-phosphate alpha-N-acetylglucosaminyl 1-phosphate transferase [Clostridiales Family XIII bacterium]|jgi:UDP-GlcNAc:undecaprenyl-phosphate GlcNAc-1-phosphate transferase|nr:undecaprenyl/decaprenyl-phosphate alpha-N-acetylglucosaminyl 1-phosphate transferase [Clostridiales Family XIII bacterium]
MTDNTSIKFVVALCFIVPFILSAFLSPVAIGLSSRIGAMDVPKDERRMHKKPVPRFGGMAIFLSAVVAFVLIRMLFSELIPFSEQGNEPIDKILIAVAGGALIYIVGVVDDLRGMNAFVKFICQIICAAFVFCFGIRIPTISLLGLNFSGETTGDLIASFVATVVWIVIITNTINLIDGLDGLAAGVAAIASLSIAYAAYIHGHYTVALCMTAIAGSAGGFLPFNFYPAKIFMGDSGALFLGFMLASVSVISPAKGATAVATLVPVLVLGVPLFDVVFAVLRRIAHRKPIFGADKGHLHHQLSNVGMGQRRSVLMLYGISSVMGIAAIVFSRQLYAEAILLFCVAVLFIIILIWEWNKSDEPVEQPPGDDLERQRKKPV